MRNVRSFYDCSTAHLPDQTAQAIDNGLFVKSPTMQNEYRWLFSVPETLSDLPEGVDCDAFKTVMALAMDAGCGMSRRCPISRSSTGRSIAVAQRPDPRIGPLLFPMPTLKWRSR